MAERHRRRHGSQRPPVETLDAEKNHTSTPRLLCFLYRRRLPPLRHTEGFFTTAFNFWSRRS
jgi:hypothetical protein